MFRAVFAFTTCIAALVIGQPAFAQQTVKFAYLADPSREAILWAYKHGKVTSEKIRIETASLTVPGLTQTMPTRQYDVVEVSPFAIPAALQRGLNLQIVGIGLRTREPAGGYNLWVRADSAIKKPEDLLDKQVALYSLRSVLAAVVRITLGEQLGLDLSRIKFVELPPPAMPPALASGTIQAASLIHAQAYQAMKSGEYRVVVAAGDLFLKAKGMNIPASVLAGYPEKIAKEPAIYTEFLRVLTASRDYAIQHPDEVFPAVATETGMTADFFSVWFRDFSEFPVAIAPQDLSALDYFWQQAKADKWIDSVPTAAAVTWNGALQAK